MQKHRSASHSHKSEGIVEVNLTPLIDVSLVLVVILLVATPMVFQSSLTVQTAAASARRAAETARTDRVEITVLSDEQVQVNTQVVARSQLQAALRPLFAESATRLAVVRCVDEVPHATFVSVLDAARMAGAEQIAVRGD